MELGSFLKEEPWDSERVSPSQLAAIISHVWKKSITTRSGKLILATLFEGDQRSVDDIVTEEKLQLTPLSREEYIRIARSLLNEKPSMVKDIVEKGQTKKVMWFVGQMIARSPDGSVEPDKAEAIMKEVLGLDDPST